MPQNAYDLENEYAVCFSDNYFQFVLVHIDGQLTGEQYEFLEHSLKMIAQEIFTPLCSTIIVRRNESQIAILLCHTADASAKIRHEYLSLLKQTQSYVSQYGKFFVTIGVGTTESEVQRLRASYLEAVNAVRSRIQYGKNHVLFPPSPEATEELMNNVLGKTEKSIITKYIETTDFDSLQRQIKAVFLKAGALQPTYSIIYFSICHVLFTLFWNVVRRRHRIWFQMKIYTAIRWNNVLP